MIAMPRTCLETLDLCFTIEFCDHLDLFSALIRSLKPYSNLRCNVSGQFQKKIQKISPCGLPSSKYAELGHFTFVF